MTRFEWQKMAQLRDALELAKLERDEARDAATLDQYELRVLRKRVREHRKMLADLRRVIG